LSPEFNQIVQRELIEVATAAESLKLSDLKLPTANSTNYGTAKQ
jgi:hypothetical protein